MWRGGELVKHWKLKAAMEPTSEYQMPFIKTAEQAASIHMANILFGTSPSFGIIWFVAEVLTKDIQKWMKCAQPQPQTVCIHRMGRMYAGCEKWKLLPNGMETHGRFELAQSLVMYQLGCRGVCCIRAPSPNFLKCRVALIKASHPTLAQMISSRNTHVSNFWKQSCA